MAETLGQVLSYINELLPNRMNSTTIITLINNEQRKLWEDMTSTAYSQIGYTSSGVAFYSLPSNCEFDSIVENGVMVATSTGVPTSTFVFEEYSYCGADDELTGYRYYEGNGDYLGLYPVPNISGYAIRVKHQERPTLFASTDTAVQFNLDQDYIDLIKFKTMARVAKAGNSPDVALANNYDKDAKEIEKRMVMSKANENVKNSRRRISYREGWDE